MIVPVILSGGTGSRLWPLSREVYPKQLLPLVNERTMLQNTVLRVQGIEALAAPMVVCNEEHRFMVAEQLRQLGIQPQSVILEPVGRNTAPAVAVAALKALESGEDPLLLVLPADHIIHDEAAFRAAVARVAPAAGGGKLATFGILPSRPETGYGYIRAEAGGEGVSPVQAFVEKPDLQTAREYLEAGDYYWNSGMFLFRASRFLQELERFRPEIPIACREALGDARQDLDFLRLDRDAFARCPSDSIDYAVMEHTREAVVAPLDVGWNDVGAWSALWEVGERDGDDNVVQGDVLSEASSGCYLRAESRLLATVGVENLVVVETPDAVLVAHRDRVQDVKTIVERLKQAGREEGSSHRKVYRPWGSYDSIDAATRFQVKRITVNPGAALSLQMHHHRAEHWVVVRGTARITRGDEVILLSENQSTYIPLGTTHRMENPGKIPLEIIEVQSGSYLGEDDIVRLDDVYGRNETPRNA